MSRLLQKTELRDRCDLLLAFEHEVEVIDQSVLHLLARNDRVDQTVFQQELRGLKSGRKFRLRRVFNDTWPGKTDHRAGLRQIQITNTRETGHHPGVRGMSQNADVRQSTLGV